MKRTRKDIGAHWLGCRAPEQRTGEEAVKFSDECWVEGLRLAVSQANHYLLIMNMIRLSFTA
ncbi:hypothetical protein [Escherichia coli]|uniref:hypothetical protein n=1 Tax=Escherichia coli TaxID=562 RepID=UPI0004D530C7|nr:hypothetical protein [Escherichia coli]ASC20252.1 hypothetical protein AM434_28845 [Escherichia coli]EGE2276700.1 hypothetical protein [Escherichia coli]EGN0133747.1 hypothetical protein [Escherichia coli]EKW4534168.1 hypothetical protein [Escherichia coli]ELK6259706.1 hypothetical protein [Escherichia coli]